MHFGESTSDVSIWKLGTSFDGPLIGWMPENDSFGESP